MQFFLVFQYPPDFLSGQHGGEPLGLLRTNHGVEPAYLTVKDIKEADCEKDSLAGERQLQNVADGSRADQAAGVVERTREPALLRACEPLGPGREIPRGLGKERLRDL